MTNDIHHIPILVKEILSFVPESTKNIFDATLWHAGHTIAFAKAFPQATVYSTDIDEQMLEKANMFIEQELGKKNNVTTIHDSYIELRSIAKKNQLIFDFMLIDLGANLEHFKNADRGFSIKNSGPLDMRFDQSKWMSLAQRFAQSHWNDLMDCFMKYADMWIKSAQPLAFELLKEYRSKKPQTTTELVDILKKMWYSDHRIAVIFQAFRITVNRELDQAELFFDHVIDNLSIWWRIAILTFHSGEELIVKNWYKNNRKKLIEIVWVPIVPTDEEQYQNKASTSAKLRVYEKK